MRSVVLEVAAEVDGVEVDPLADALDTVAPSALR
jgi:hypothetical protein